MPMNPSRRITWSAVIWIAALATVGGTGIGYLLGVSSGHEDAEPIDGSSSLTTTVSSVESTTTSSTERPTPTPPRAVATPTTTRTDAAPLPSAPADQLNPAAPEPTE